MRRRMKKPYQQKVLDGVPLTLPLLKGLDQTERTITQRTAQGEGQRQGTRILGYLLFTFCRQEKLTAFTLQE